MKNILTGLTLLLLVSCSQITETFAKTLSTEELTTEVKKSIRETLDKKHLENQKIKNLTLVHLSGNEYSGVLETTYWGIDHTNSVEVIYDGENLKWEIKP